MAVVSPRAGSETEIVGAVPDSRDVVLSPVDVALRRHDQHYNT